VVLKLLVTALVKSSSNVDNGNSVLYFPKNPYHPPDPSFPTQYYYMLIFEMKRVKGRQGSLSGLFPYVFVKLKTCHQSKEGLLYPYGFKYLIIEKVKGSEPNQTLE